MYSSLLTPYLIVLSTFIFSPHFRGDPASYSLILCQRRLVLVLYRQIGYHFLLKSSLETFYAFCYGSYKGYEEEDYQEAPTARE
jgi:hypothetical protein